MATITMDPNYGYAILAATATFWLGAVHTANTGKYRGRAKVAYPAAYAPADRTDHAALCFNGAQRAHANYIENQAQTVPAILIAGLQYPKAAGLMGAVWCLSRFAYMVGYSKGLEGGKGRYQKGGPIFWFAQLGLIGTATWVGIKFITGW